MSSSKSRNKITHDTKTRNNVKIVHVFLMGLLQNSEQFVFRDDISEQWMFRDDISEQVLFRDFEKSHWKYIEKLDIVPRFRRNG